MYKLAVVRYCVIAVLGGCLAAAPSSPAFQRQPTSPEVKARMIRLIGQLESDPYAKDGKDIRREVLVWLIDAPDVTVGICTNVLGDIKKLKGDDGATLTTQLAFSQAKYILEHPDKAADKHAVNIAGVEGVLRTYEAMKRAKPKVKFAPMEQLLQLQSNGGLDAFVDSGLAQCK